MLLKKVSYGKSETFQKNFEISLQRFRYTVRTLRVLYISSKIKFSLERTFCNLTLYWWKWALENFQLFNRRKQYMPDIENFRSSSRRK
jgi:hypothetical protein